MRKEIKTTMDQILESRENRAALQKTLMEKYERPLVCFTVIMPGRVKRNRQTDIIYRAGVKAIRQELSGYIVNFSHKDLLTGPEAYFSIDEMTPEYIKKQMIRIEERHFLGRVMDIDVLSAPGKPLSRADLGLPPRKCLFCDQPAAVCVRTRAHPAGELRAYVEDLVEQWLAIPRGQR